jgi:hypothetical protein
MIAERKPIEGLCEDKHFMLLDAANRDLNSSQLALMSEAVRRWYQQKAHSRRAVHRLKMSLQKSLCHAES